MNKILLNKLNHKFKENGYLILKVFFIIHNIKSFKWQEEIIYIINNFLFLFLLFLMSLSNFFILLFLYLYDLLHLFV